MKKKIKVSYSNSDTKTILKAVISTVKNKFDTDKTMPGVLISELKNNEHYVSVVRFGNYFGKDKVVEVKSKQKTLRKALLDVLEQLSN